MQPPIIMQITVATSFFIGHLAENVFKIVAQIESEGFKFTLLCSAASGNMFG